MRLSSNNPHRLSARCFGGICVSRGDMGSHSNGAKLSVSYRPDSDQYFRWPRCGRDGKCFRLWRNRQNCVRRLRDAPQGDRRCPACIAVACAHGDCLRFLAPNVQAFQPARRKYFCRGRDSLDYLTLVHLNRTDRARRFACTPCFLNIINAISYRKGLFLGSLLVPTPTRAPFARVSSMDRCLLRMLFSERSLEAPSWIVSGLCSGGLREEWRALDTIWTDDKWNAEYIAVSCCSFRLRVLC